MIAFFDFDKTLISINSGTLWVKREVKGGFMTKWDAVRASAWMFQYHLGFVNLESAVKEIVGSLRGTKEAELCARINAFYADEVRALYRPGARRVIDEHRAAGEKLVILTSASCYMADHVSKELSFHDVLANRFEVDEAGVYTGRSHGEMIYGEGKLRVAREYADRAGVPLAKCAFYTDSIADVSLMEVVGKPVAVNPDPRLRKHAKKRGWAIADWGLPGL